MLMEVASSEERSEPPRSEASGDASSPNVQEPSVLRAASRRFHIV